MPKKSEKKTEDYESIGKLLISIAELGTSDRKKLYWVSFWKGVWGGLGGFIGATLVVAILLWIFTIAGNVPLIGPVIELVRDQIKN